MNKMACPFVVVAEKVVLQIPFICMAYSCFVQLLTVLAQNDDLIQQRRIKTNSHSIGINESSDAHQKKGHLCQIR